MKEHYEKEKEVSIRCTIRQIKLVQLTTFADGSTQLPLLIIFKGKGLGVTALKTKRLAEECL